MKRKLVQHTQFSMVMFRINPFVPNGLFYLKALDQSISNKKRVWLILIITIFYRNSYI